MWSATAHNRVSFFVWAVAWEKILACDNLIKWGLTLVGWCSVCLCSGDTVDHLLPNFDVALFLFGWRNWFEKHYSAIWNFALFCLMLLLWKE